MHHWHRRDVDAVRQAAGVGEQDPHCTHTDDPLPCADCLLGGGA